MNEEKKNKFPLLILKTNNEFTMLWDDHTSLSFKRPEAIKKFMEKHNPTIVFAKGDEK